MKPAKYISEMRDEVANDSRNDLHNTYSVKNHVPHFVPGYKRMYQNQLAVNKGLLVALGVVIVAGIATYIGSDIRANKIKYALDHYQCVKMVPVSETNDVEAATKSATLNKKNVFTGKVSFYSKDGCIGCNENQKMANGEIFDENLNTIAFNKAPLNTWVTVTNLDNGKSILAQVTDRGGFEKYNRIADLSKRTCRDIGCKTDVSNIEISY